MNNKELFIKQASRFLELIMRDGLKEEFSLCCIAQFAIENLLDLSPPQERIKKFGKKLGEALDYSNDNEIIIGFIPCDKCVHKFIRKINKIRKESPNE